MQNEAKCYRVIIGKRTTDMLVAHARFLANVSESAAERLVFEFEAKAKSLETFPERNPYLSNPLIPADKYRQLLFAKRYLLLYFIKGDNVFVDAVVDCRQEYAWLL